MPAPSVNSGHTTYESAGSSNSHVVDAPSHSEGDGIWIAIVVDGAQTLTPPAGFVGAALSISAANHTATLGVYRKTAGASEPSTYTVQCSSSERAAAISWSQSNDNSFDVTASDSDTSSTANCPSATTTEDNTLILRIVGTDSETLPHGTISGYTKLDEVERSSGGTVSVQYTTQASAGATGAENVSLNSSQEWRGVTVAVKGVASGGGFQVAWGTGINNLVGAF